MIWVAVVWRCFAVCWHPKITEFCIRLGNLQFSLWDKFDIKITSSGVVAPTISSVKSETPASPNLLVDPSQYRFSLVLWDHKRIYVPTNITDRCLAINGAFWQSVGSCQSSVQFWNICNPHVCVILNSFVADIRTLLPLQWMNCLITQKWC